MRVLSFEAQNIMRLSTFFYTFPTDESVTIVGGLNASGKSSALQALAMALGGKALCPDEPLKRGETSGVAKVDLEDYIVTRRFWRRESFACDVDHQHNDKCPVVYGEIDTDLTIKSRDGQAEFKSPQAMLDKLISDFTFDPLSFLELQPRQQKEMVRQFTGLDFTILDTQRKTALQHQSEAETELKLAQREVDAGEHYDDAPAAPIDVADLLMQLAKAEQLEKTAVDAEAAVEAELRRHDMYAKYITEGEKKVKDLEEALAFAKRSLETDRQGKAESIDAGKKLRAAAVAARAAVPNTTALRDQVAKANEVNGHVAANERYAAILTAKQDAQNNVATAKAQIAEIDARKVDALSKAKYPVDGLGFSDDGLTFNGLPFEQASYAEQLRVAVAMGLALNPKLKLLLIRHGNALDAHSLQLLTELAAAAGAQVIVERVAESPEGVSVFIQDGVSQPVMPRAEAVGA